MGYPGSEVSRVHVHSVDTYIDYMVRAGASTNINFT